MIYVIGTVGFLFGFYAGLMILRVLLRGKTNAELTTDKSLWWKYGWVVWVTSFAGVWIGFQIYTILYSN